MKYRFPIKVTGFIEMDGEATVFNDGVTHRTNVVVDEFDWEFSPWPRASAYGQNDDLIVQIDDGKSRVLNADTNIVVPLREMVAQSVYDHARWATSRTVEKDITDGTE